MSGAASSIPTVAPDRGARGRVAGGGGSPIVFDAFQVASALLLMALVVHPPPGMHPAGRLVAALGLVMPPLARRFTSYWLLLLLLYLTSPLDRAWFAPDNHEFLQLYWLLALFISRFATNPIRALKVAARWLIALVFVFATLWKVLAPDFLDGATFEFLFAVEPRLADVAVMTGIQRPVDAGNRAAIEAWREPGSAPEPARLEVSETVRRISPPLSAATLLVEGAVAVAFLAPMSRRRAWLRDAALLTFIVVTYPLTPVLPFAWVLLSLGAMQSTLSARLRNRLYVGVFATVTVLFVVRGLAMELLAV